MAASNGLSRSRPIFVVGMDRSGTSVVANMIYEWGAYGGDPQVLGNSLPTNRHGSWENRDARKLVHELLWRSPVRFWDPRYPTVVKERAHEPGLAARTRAFVDSMARTNPTWFCKEPCLSVQLPFWQQFVDAVYVITVRNPYDSAVSYDAMFRGDGYKGVSLVAYHLLRWQMFMLAILRDTVDRKKLFIAYEDLVRDPHRTARRLDEFLHAACGGSGESRAAAMGSIVDPGLQHGEQQPIEQIPILTSEQKALYRLLQARVVDPEVPFDEDAYALYPGSVEYCNNMEWSWNFVQRTNRLLDTYPGRFAVAWDRAMDGARRRYRLVADKMRWNGIPSNAPLHR